MPREITITLPDITEETTETELSFLPESFTNDLLNACFEDGAKCSRYEYFFCAGFQCAMAILTDHDSTGKNLRKFTELFFNLTQLTSDPLGRFPVDAAADELGHDGGAR